MREVPAFVEDYNRVEVPQLAYSNSPQESRLDHDIQGYFDRLARALDLSYLVTSSTLSVATDIELSRVGTRPTYYRQFDDLWFNDAQVLGSVIRKVGGGVLQSVRVSKYALNLETIQTIQNFHNEEQSLTRLIFSS